MGFGLLFLGYFTVIFMSWHTFGSLVQLAGYGVILLALMKLRRYHRSFDLACVGTAVMLAVTAVIAVGDVSDFLYENLILSSRFFSDSLSSVMEYVDQAAFLIFHALLLWGIRMIARETEVLRLEANAVRNFIFIFLYEIVAVAAILPIAFLRSLRAELVLISLLLYFICTILNLVLFASCYARICDEGDVDMMRKASRFAFVNRFREASEQREQKNFESGQAYRAKREEKKQKRKGKS